MHNMLNTEIWVNNKLRKEVRDALLKLSHRILKDSKIPKNTVTDIIFTGSLASYNYSKNSDLDLHFIVDFDKINVGPQYVEQFLNQIKTIWNDRHNVDILDYDVEIYFQDVEADLVANSVYSVIDETWLRGPEKPRTIERPSKYKYNKIKKIIDDIISMPPSQENIERVEHLQDKISKYRLCGLERVGEMSTENLTYKKLRANGYIDRLYALGDELYDQYYSVRRVRHKI